MGNMKIRDFRVKRFKNGRNDWFKSNYGEESGYIFVMIIDRYHLWLGFYFKS